MFYILLQIDVAVPLQHHKLTPTYAITETGAVCEAKAGYKSSELWRLCNRFFQTDLRNFNKSPRVFISYEKFTDTEVAQYTTKGSVSGHDAREKVVELIKGNKLIPMINCFSHNWIFYSTKLWCMCVCSCRICCFRRS